MKYKSTLSLHRTNRNSLTIHILFDVIHRKKNERFMLPFYYNLNSCENESQESDRRVFFFFFNSLSLCHWAIMAVFFENVTLVILKLNASTMGNLFAASGKRVREGERTSTKKVILRQQTRNNNLFVAARQQSYPTSLSST